MDKLREVYEKYSKLITPDTIADELCMTCELWLAIRAAVKPCVWTAIRNDKEGWLVWVTSCGHREGMEPWEDNSEWTSCHYCGRKIERKEAEHADNR